MRAGSSGFQRAVDSAAIPLLVAGTISEQRLGVFLAAAGMELEDRGAAWLARQSTIAGGAFTPDFGGHPLDRRLVGRQLISGQQLRLHLQGAVHAQPRERLLLPVERQGIVMLGRSHRGGRPRRASAIVLVRQVSS